jgi:hypothetical protein
MTPDGRPWSVHAFCVRRSVRAGIISLLVSLFISVSVNLGHNHDHCRSSLADLSDWSEAEREEISSDKIGEALVTCI